jgi:hypothetical protein
MIKISLEEFLKVGREDCKVFLRVKPAAMRARANTKTM